MNAYRKHMIENGGNLGWCKPMTNGSTTIAMQEGKVVGILENGKDAGTVTDDKIRELARRLNEDYEIYKGWSDTHILMDADWEEGECRHCPWFGVCDAMDNPDYPDSEG